MSTDKKNAGRWVLAQRDQTLRIRFDGFELNEADARLRCNGAPIPLAPKAFAVLCTLARQPGVLVTKGDLLDAVWGHQHVSESVLKTIISELRSALATDYVANLIGRAVQSARELVS